MCALVHALVCTRGNACVRVRTCVRFFARAYVCSCTRALYAMRAMPCCYRVSHDRISPVFRDVGAPPPTHPPHPHPLPSLPPYPCPQTVRRQHRTSAPSSFPLRFASLTMYVGISNDFQTHGHAKVPRRTPARRQFP